MESYKKFITNLAHTKDGRGQCESVLGNTVSLNSFAVFFKNNVIDMQVVAAYLLANYTANKTFDHKELEAFKQGLGGAMSFFSDCLVEVNKKERDSLDLSAK